MNRPALTAERFDRMVAPRGSKLALDGIWGWATIAKHIGVSVDFAKKLAKEDGSPIRIVAGRPFTTRSALDSWLLPRSTAI